MRSHICKVFFLLSWAFLYCKPVWSETQDYWQCIAHDKLHQTWVVKSPYSISASNKAFEACKKNSKEPQSCKLSFDEDCEGFYDGKSNRANWECTAIDQHGEAWKSAPDFDQDHATMQALERCKKESTVSDTCYVNVLSCENLNQR